MAKLKVLKPFRDKVDKKTWHKPGQVINITDEERSKDLVTRGLCAVAKGKASDKKPEKPEETQQPSNEAEGNENPETGSDEQPEE